MAGFEITKEIRFRENNLGLSILRCICGARFHRGQFTIDGDAEYPFSCPECKRELYFTSDVRVYEKLHEREKE